MRKITKMNQNLGKRESYISSEHTFDLEDFNCGICHDFCKEPTQCQSCYNFFCKRCILTWLKINW